MFSMAPLLMYSEHVSVGAKRALALAASAGPLERGAALAQAARILKADSGLDCTDVRELVGLPPGGSCV